MKTGRLGNSVTHVGINGDVIVCDAYHGTVMGKTYVRGGRRQFVIQGEKVGWLWPRNIKGFLRGLRQRADAYVSANTCHSCHQMAPVPGYVTDGICDLCVDMEIEADDVMEPLRQWYRDQADKSTSDACVSDPANNLDLDTTEQHFMDELNDGGPADDDIDHAEREVVIQESLEQADHMMFEDLQL